ncbi:MAG: tyrosine recombinase XerC [Clostridiales bacterium]|nr:tyrosine recombinase XerC [Clostridiales bacterium]
MINTEGNPFFLNSFLDYTATILNKSPNTIKEYNYDLNNFLKFILMHFKMTNKKDLKEISIHDMTLDTVSKIKLEDIHAYLFYLNNNFQSKPATRARKAASIRVFFNYLSNKSGMIEKNPAQNLESPKQDRRIPKYLSLDDSKKLLEAATNIDDRNKERDFAIITLFLNCGMRLSELVGINFKDINFNDCKLNVIGKGNKERTIYLNKACMNALNSYIAVRPRDGVKSNSRDALFLSERKERISNRTVQYIVKQELHRAGLDTNKYSVHKLRHTAATLMYQYGNVDIRALQELLGHESISTTEIYTHVDNSQIRNAVESNPLANL